MPMCCYVNIAGIQVMIYKRIEEIIIIVFMYVLILLLSTPLVNTRLVY